MVKVVYMLDYRGEDTQIGGTAGYLRLLASHVSNRGYDVRVALPMSPRHHHLQAALREAAIPIDDADTSPQAGHAFSRLHTAYTYFSMRRPDIAHFMMPWWNACEYGILGASLAGVRARVVSYSGMPPALDELVDVFGGWAGFIRGGKHRLARRLVNHSFAVSEAGRRQLVLDGFHPEEKTSVARCGIEFQASAAVPGANYSFRQECDIPEPSFLIAVVGNLEEIKGHRYLIQALPGILDQFPHVFMIILGDGVLRPTLKTQVKDSGLSRSVMFAGWRKDVPRILAASDVLVLPSLSEGLPLAVLEAMAAGLPIVASNVGGVPEAVIDGETGFLVEPSSARSLREAILKLLKDPERARSMGAAGRTRVRAEFGVDRMVEETCEVYRNLLRNSSN